MVVRRAPLVGIVRCLRRGEGVGVRDALSPFVRSPRSQLARVAPRTLTPPKIAASHRLGAAAEPSSPPRPAQHVRDGLRVLQTKGAGARGGQQVAHQARLAAERWHYKAGEAIDTDAD